MTPTKWERRVRGGKKVEVSTIAEKLECQIRVKSSFCEAHTCTSIGAGRCSKVL